MFDAEVYVFGSMVTGGITGASVVDVPTSMPGGYSELEPHVRLSPPLSMVAG